MPCALSIKIKPDSLGTSPAMTEIRSLKLTLRHCERSEAIHRATQKKNGLLRCARNDGSCCLKIESVGNDGA
jgi:hypothetical protein